MAKTRQARPSPIPDHNDDYDDGNDNSDGDYDDGNDKNDDGDKMFFAFTKNTISNSNVDELQGLLLKKKKTP